MDESQNTLQLPAIPKDCYYEDYVASILNAGGFYLDRSVHLSEDGTDLLELDVVATKFENDHYDETIVEVKSGGWGVRDLFKVNGWLNYLGYDKAAFIYQNPSNSKDESIMQEVAQELNIKLLGNPLQSNGNIDDSAILSSFGINLTPISKPAVMSLRYSYDLERVMLNYIHAFSNQNKSFHTPCEVYHYFRELIDDSFFIKDPLDRLHFLTDISKRYRNIACILDNELKGKGVLPADQCTKFDNLYEIENPVHAQCRPVDVALYVQLLNRLLVLKSITEYLLTPSKLESNYFEEFLFKLNYDTQNSNIKHAIEFLRSQPHFCLYPYFYQVFFYIYGGFFMTERKDEEYQTLSDITGIPVGEINQTLDFWDILFPTATHWMTKINHGGLYYMRFVPAPLRGVGVNYRRYQYAPSEQEGSEDLFNNIKCMVGEKCFNDMLHWNNAAFIMLNQDRNLQQPTNKSSSKFDCHITAAESYIHNRAIYSAIKPLIDLANSVHRPNFNIQGFLCTLHNNLYDLYIIKNDNNLLKFPISQVITDLKLDQGLMRYCYIMGTDDYNKKSDDTIWITATLHHASLERLDEVINELDKIE